MENNYKGFRGWLRYVRDYKDNIDNDLISEQRLIEANNRIERLENVIKEYEYVIKEKNKQLEHFEVKIEDLKDKLSKAKQDYNDLLLSFTKINANYDELKEKIQEKELLRRKCAGQVGGLKAKISVLKKDLARAKQKINWLSNNQKAPTKEEIQAYETRMKEVEKRQKSID